jgi:DNA-binding MarR family transcriptional regulator
LKAATAEIDAIERAALTGLSAHEAALFRRFLARIAESVEDPTEG